MATTTLTHQFSIGDQIAVIQSIASPGTGVNDITTGLSYVNFTVASAGTTPDKAVIATPNTSDHSTEANGHVTVQAEADVTITLFSIGR